MDHHLRRRVGRLEASAPSSGKHNRLDAEIERLLAALEARDGPEKIKRLTAEFAQERGLPWTNGGQPRGQ